MRSTPDFWIRPGFIVAFAISGIVLFLFLTFPMWVTIWPPDWVERRTQRRILEERVQAVGGWDVLKRDCRLLVEQNRTNVFRSFYNTNGLPPAIIGLKPQRVSYVPPELWPGSEEEQRALVVEIRVFGLPRTGGNASPYLALEVVCSTNNPPYKPKIQGGGGVPGNRYSTFRQVTNDVFEIY